jgi:TonB family protein
MAHAQNSAAGKKSPEIYSYTGQMPEPGDGLNKYLSENLHYPDSARMKGIEGKVFLKFVVNEDGRISDCTVLKGIGGGCDEEALRVGKAMPAWKPGMKDGKAEKVWTSFPVQFKLKREDDGRVYNYVEQMPKMNFDYNKYIAEHLRYPDSALRNNIEGKVLVRFVVNENGTVSDLMLLSNVRGGCNKEALRLIQNMPAWTPGKQNGNPVKVLFNLPVEFNLKSYQSLSQKATDSLSLPRRHEDDAPFSPFDIGLYLRTNLHYPQAARENGISGRVLIKFVVNENGAISDCQVVNGPGGGLNGEALKVVKNMPAWIPAIQNGKPVKVYFTLPVKFILENGYGSRERKADKTDDYYYDHNDEPDVWPEAGYDHVAYISEHVHYPESARKNKIQGDVMVAFIVNKEGEINSCRILYSLDPRCDSEALLVVKNMPKWKPGKYNRKPVSAEQLTTVSFYPSEEEKRNAISKKIYHYVEQMPVSAVDPKKYIADHLIYPDSLKKKNVFGTVFVKFIITETGALDSVSILKGLGNGCDEEAMRVVKSMPDWKPGMQNGKPVKVWFNLSVSFAKTITTAEIAAAGKAYEAARPRRTYDFLKYVSDSLHYPDSALKNEISGTVIIGFSVSEKGIISNCNVSQGLGYGCDEEALRLVQNMPQWRAHVTDGPSIYYPYSQSIKFDLREYRRQLKKKMTQEHPKQ